MSTTKQNEQQNSEALNENEKSMNVLIGMRYKRFLSLYTPFKIEEKLNMRIVGQEELTKSTADFLYYHALRQLKPELPPRPMLISGPSGTGKTEVWRAVKKIFGDVFKIEIVDGSCMTEEGWKGDNKLSSHIDKEISEGGILIIDEFDKLAKPRYESNGSNVAASMQAEFLKLLEGEYTKEEDKKVVAAIFRAGASPIPDELKINTKKMGVVLIGAFDGIKCKSQNQVGFGDQDLLSLETSGNITDEEYIEFGILPELIERIATKVTTNQLSDNEYVQIIHNPYSRVSIIIDVFKEFGVDLTNLVNDAEIRTLIQRSKSNKTGVRWVSAQIESKMLEVIREEGVGIIIDTCEQNKSLNQFVPYQAIKVDEFLF